MVERVATLKAFWEIAEEMRPVEIDRASHSFYKIDNDSLFAGFSDCPGMQRGIDVLKWLLELRAELLRNGIHICASANLCAVDRPITWKIDKGLIDDSTRLHIPDEVFVVEGIKPERIVADIVTASARLLEIAKENSIPIVFSTFQGGHIDHPRRILIELPAASSILRVGASEMSKIKPSHREWLEVRNISAFALQANSI
jgi:hypothetical protein